MFFKKNYFILNLIFFIVCIAHAVSEYLLCLGWSAEMSAKSTRGEKWISLPLLYSPFSPTSWPGDRFGRVEEGEATEEASRKASSGGKMVKRKERGRWKSRRRHAGRHTHTYVCIPTHTHSEEEELVTCGCWLPYRKLQSQLPALICLSTQPATAAAFLQSTKQKRWQLRSFLVNQPFVLLELE